MAKASTGAKAGAKPKMSTGAKVATAVSIGSTIADFYLSALSANKQKNAMIEAANAQRAANEYNLTLLSNRKNATKKALSLSRKFSKRKDFRDLASAEVAAFNATGQQSLNAQVENAYVVANSSFQQYRNDVTKIIDLENAMTLTKLEGEATIDAMMAGASAVQSNAFANMAGDLGKISFDFAKSLSSKGGKNA